MAEKDLKWLDNFKPPTTVVELLERGHEWAQDEQRWADGAWFQVKDETIMFDDKGDWIGYDALSCRNVKACAMGILVLASQDGPLIKEYFREGENTGIIDDVLHEDLLLRPATLLLADAVYFVRYGQRSTQHVDSGYVSDAQSEVIVYNDGHAQASDIERAFAEALERAREHGLDTPGAQLPEPSADPGY